MERELGKIKHNSPDLKSFHSDSFVLDKDNLPSRLKPILKRYSFKRCSMDEIENSSDLTSDAWPGLPETTRLDLRARDIINSPMLGAYTKEGKMIGYTRLLWGYDNNGNPEVMSHMTAVRHEVRDGGIGEALKWYARQIALEFPSIPVKQMITTFDNLQGRNCNVNFSKLGMVCGYSGGLYKQDAYGKLTGEQHIGNSTDRYLARWYLDSKWTMAHLESTAKIPTIAETREIPSVIKYEFSFNNFQPTPTKVIIDLSSDYLTVPVPLNWDQLLVQDKNNDYNLAKKWRKATKQVLETYYQLGYTTIAQVTDIERGANFQIMSSNFDPFEPKKELLLD